MIYKIILEIVGKLYKDYLRELVVKAIDDPNSEVDDFVLDLLDKLLNGKQG